MPYEPTNPACPKCKSHGDKWPELKNTGTQWYCYYCDSYFEKLPGKKPGKKIGELYIGSAEHKKQKEDGDPSNPGNYQNNPQPVSRGFGGVKIEDWLYNKIMDSKIDLKAYLKT